MRPTNCAILALTVCAFVRVGAYVPPQQQQQQQPRRHRPSVLPIDRRRTCNAAWQRQRPGPTLSPTLLRDISEWRDLWFDIPPASPSSSPNLYPAIDSPPGSATNDNGKELLPKREICILPFPYQEVLLQGETKQLRLYEDRFLQLFDTAMNDHCGVVAMGLLADTGIVKTVTLCELEAYNRLDGFGVFCTIRVVGRAELCELTQQEPYLKAYCREITDTIPINLELPNLMATSVETSMDVITNMEQQLEQAKLGVSEDGDDDNDGDASETSQNGSVTADNATSALDVSSNTTSSTDANETDDKNGQAGRISHMERRVQIAKLEDRFYDDLGDDEDDEVQELDRRGRYRQAYNVALVTDTQGYQLSKVATSTANNPGSYTERSPQELSAVSWAAFCTDVLSDENATLRIRALDCDNLFDRLKMALHMLGEKKAALKNAMKEAGLKITNDDLDEEL